MNLEQVPFKPCRICGYHESTLGCENPACDLAHWHTQQTLDAKHKLEAERAAFEASINRIDYSLSFQK